MDLDFTRYEQNEEKRRTEIDFVISFEGAVPPRKEIMEQLSSLYTFDPALAVLGKFRTRSGKKEMRGDVRIYENRDDMKQAERRQKR